MKNKFGAIYVIKNKITTTVYLGSSIEVEKRLSKHKSLLKYNKHYNKHLQNAYNKYGENNFEFTILDRWVPIENIKNVEQEYIDYVFKNCKVYNKAKYVAGSAGYIHNNDKLEKISNASKGKKKSQEFIIKMSRPILQYDLDGNFIKEWVGLRDASRNLNIPHKSIYNCCRGYCKRCSEFIFKYK